MGKISVCLDVGGTFTKGMVYNQENHSLLNEIKYYPSKSNQSEQIILTNFTEIIIDLVQQVSFEQHEVNFVGLAFPGPFDYEQGVSYIKGLEKFASLFKINIKQALQTRLKDYDEKLFSDTELYFMNDAIAFAFGENDVSKVNTGVYLTLGTGLGSTFLKKKEIIRGKVNIPKSGMIYEEKFKYSIMDDYLSDRGLRRISNTILETDIGGKEVYDMALRNNVKAIMVFEQFGAIIGEALKPYIEAVNPEEIVFGGQISGSFHFFKKTMLHFFPQTIAIRASKDTSMSILNGVFICHQERVQY